MPIITVIGSASARGFGLFGGTVDSAPYWIGQSYTGTEDIGGGVNVDSSGNVYLSGYTKAGFTSSPNTFAQKLNASGSPQWSKALESSSVDIAYAVKVRSNGNPVIAGRATDSGFDSVLFAVYNPANGDLTYNAVIRNLITQNLSIDASDNMYTAAYVPSGASGVVFKIDDSVAIVWQKTISAVSPKAIDVDSSGNVAVLADVNSAGNYLVVMLFNSSGTLQWQRSLTNTSTFVAGGCAIDVNGNVYVSGYAKDGAVDYGVTAKYNSSGTLQWQRKLGSATNNIRWYGLAIDAQRNVYVAGEDIYSFPDVKAMIAKYDQYGNLLLQRSMSSSGGDAFIGITAPAGSAMYVNGYSTVRGTGGLLFAKLPVNGSLTGTYSVGGNNFTYATTSVTEAAASYTDAAGATTIGTGAYGLVSPTLTIRTPAVSTAVTTI